MKYLELALYIYLVGMPMAALIVLVNHKKWLTRTSIIGERMPWDYRDVVAAAIVILVVMVTWPYWLVWRIVTWNKREQS